MIKIIPPRSWDSDGPQIEIVKVASAGLRGYDFTEFVKRASHPLALWVRSNPPLPGEVFVHNIALSSTETGGPNRNGDGYSNTMLGLDHPTFEKYARFYRNHKNTDPLQSYGYVKRSYHNAEIGRVDVVCALNATKEAAERNKGLIAERTLNKLAAGQDVAVSQSCNVARDTCISCGNSARHRGEYCGPETCKYGGCRDNLGRVFDDGFHLYVDNPRCKFFDMSDVSDTRGADRTAFITGKVATAVRTIGGAELADNLGLTAPDHLLDRDTLSAVKHLRKLASFPAYKLEAAPTWDDCVRVRDQRAFTKSSAINFPADDWARQEIVNELASAGIVLPPSRWLSYMTGTDHLKCAALFIDGLDVNRDLLSRPDAHEILCATPTPGDKRLSTLKKWAWLKPTKLAHALESALGVISADAQVLMKVAAFNAPANVAAEAKSRYLAYQAKVLSAVENSEDLALLQSECRRHNQGTTI